ncbi:MAG TPA: arginine--tRNA ligase [Candidatus Acidoferrales bacterium]|nr:arginine--tRNA ligase [Candidatus Acidoferrales bacterium]
MKSHLRELLTRACEKAAKGGELNTTDLPPLLLEPPSQKEFGDLATNVALLWAKKVRKPPRAVAELIVNEIDDPEKILARVEIAGPGFINFTFAAGFVRERLRELARAERWAPDIGRGQKVQVEFASVNPTGPLHVGHGRVAVIGDALARLLGAVGYDVEREYYVNDAGRQIELLGESIYARYRELFGLEGPFPEDGYRGDYIKELAARARAEWGERFLCGTDEAIDFLSRFGCESLLAGIRDDLASFGIAFDSFISEREMRARGEVAQALALLRERDLIYDEAGAQWFRATRFGDDKDRPVVKSDGELTYFASDIAYHRSKFERGHQRLINVWGADHHGYVSRLKAALQALGYDPARLDVVLVQMVNLTRQGEPVRMGKRSGEFVSLREVLDEVGRDAARFFFLMRKADTHLEFDLELAKKESSENPVFYVQYAHARIASILEQARQKNIVLDREAVELARLALPEELDLIKSAAQLPEVVEDSARELEPHYIVAYLLDLAGQFHRYYNRHRVISDDPGLTGARLFLAESVQQTVRRGLELLGISAPTRMESRAQSEDAARLGSAQS